MSPSSRIRSMAPQMTSTSTGARPGKGWSGKSRLGFPFCISLASVGGSAEGLVSHPLVVPPWAASDESPVCGSLVN